MSNHELRDDNEGDPETQIDLKGGSFQQFKLTDLAGEHAVSNISDETIQRFDPENMHNISYFGFNTSRIQKFDEESFSERPGIDAAIINLAAKLALDSDDPKGEVIADMSVDGLVEPKVITDFLTNKGVKEVIIRPSKGKLAISLLPFSTIPKKVKFDGDPSPQGNSPYNVELLDDGSFKKDSYPSEDSRRKDILG